MDNPYKHLRQSLGLSNGEMAKILNLYRSTWWRYEEGMRKPSFVVMIKIRRICKQNGIDFNDLFGDKE